MPRCLLLFALLAGLVLPDYQESVPTGDHAKRLDKIREFLTEAGTLYKEQDFPAAARQVNLAQALLFRACAQADESLRPVLEKEYRRIARAHQLLKAEGVVMQPLAAFPEQLGGGDEADEPDDPPADEAGDMDSATAGQISFTRQIAPILVRECGRCHIQKDRGDYRMQNFDSLVNGAPGGDAVVAGKPADSLLLQMIEDGSMPPTTEMEPDQVELIRAWIADGARFDGEDPKAPMVSQGGRDR